VAKTDERKYDILRVHYKPIILYISYYIYVDIKYYNACNIQRDSIFYREPADNTLRNKSNFKTNVNLISIA